jgi:hypothetical protein
MFVSTAKEKRIEKEREAEKMKIEKRTCEEKWK